MRQATRLEEDRAGNADPADVVQESGVADAFGPDQGDEVERDRKARRLWLRTTCR
jgi:hypothetical protein